MIPGAPGALAAALRERLGAALALIDRAAAAESDARSARAAATGLYHATAAALLLFEAEQLGDPVRADLARLVIAHKLSPRDPLAPSAFEDEAAADRVIDALVTARVSA
jgi:acyl-CoA dehydrogenase